MHNAGKLAKDTSREAKTSLAFKGTHVLINGAVLILVWVFEFGSGLY